MSSLLIWNSDNKDVHKIPWFPQKPYPIPDQNGQIVYPFSDQNGARTLPDRAAHTYIAYIREYPPPRGQDDPRKLSRSTICQAKFMCPRFKKSNSLEKQKL